MASVAVNTNSPTKMEPLSPTTPKTEPLSPKTPKMEPVTPMTPGSTSMSSEPKHVQDLTVFVSTDF